MITISQTLKAIDESSYEEVVNKCIERIKNNKLNTFITIAEESALERAKNINNNATNNINNNNSNNKNNNTKNHPQPLAGVPIAIKDNISTKGIRTTCASNILTGYVPPYDAHVIERLKEAGAIIVGKANMDEFAMGTSTETSYYGPALNPWNTEHVSGGSSGGSAATVAAGEVPIALGSDTGGSVRCPASYCSVVGLKPTYGIISRYGLISYANSLEQIGPIATNVRDMTLLFNVIAGYDSRDSTSVQLEKDYTGSLVNDVKGLVIGVPDEYFGEGTEPAVEKAVWDGVHTLEGLGASWKKVEMPHTRYALAAYYIIAMSEASSNLARFDGMRYGLRLTKDHDWHTTYSEIRAKGFGEEVKRRILLGTYALSAGYMDKYYLKALKVRTLVKQDFDRALKDTDVLIAPTMPAPAFKLGEKISDPLTLYLADVNTVPINLAGVPSISLPCGFDNGLPIGLQIIGRHFDEETVIRVAYTFEQNTDFHTMSPEVR